MKKLVLIVLIAVVSLPACKTAQKAVKNPQANVETAIPVMIKLLEAGSYKEFLSTFLVPETKEKFGGDEGMSELADKWGKSEKKDKLLNSLKAAKELTPIYNEDKTKATYKKEAIDNFKDLVFEKIDGLWYIAN